MTFKHVLLLIAIAIVLLAVASHLASAQEQNCGPRAQVVSVLNGKYQEFRRAVGLISEKVAIELFVSKRGTWTLLSTNNVSIACVMAAGEAWFFIPGPPAPLP